MSIIERLLPVQQTGINFFDHIFSGMEREVAEMQADAERMRRMMCQLVPFNDKDVSTHEMQVPHPIIEEKCKSKLHLTFDVNSFKPEEVHVKVVGDNILEVNAEHHEKDDKSESYRRYIRHFSLPSGVDANNIISELSTDGVLTIEAPAPPLSPEERPKPIEFKPAAK